MWLIVGTSVVERGRGLLSLGGCKVFEWERADAAHKLKVREERLQWERAAEWIELC